MGEFLVELVGTAAGVAAGTAGTAAGGPLVGAVAGAAAAKLTSSLVGDLLHVQDAQLLSFEALNRNLNGGLTRVEAGLFRVEGQVQQVQADLHTQLEEPWKTANLYLESAAEPQLSKANRDDYLIHARDKLFEAFSVAKNDVRRALVAQRLAAIALMLNDGPSARNWLTRAYPIIARFVISAAAEVEKLFVIEWDNSQTVAKIVAKVGGPEPMSNLTFPLTGELTTLGQIPSLVAKRASPQDFATSYRYWRLSERLANRPSPENFWVRYIKATASDREAIQKAQDISDETLTSLVHVQAIRRLYWMVRELRDMRTASRQLGADSREFPEYTLVVDLVPLRKPEVRVITGASAK